MKSGRLMMVSDDDKRFSVPATLFRISVESAQHQYSRNRLPSSSRSGRTEKLSLLTLFGVLAEMARFRQASGAESQPFYGPVQHAPFYLQLDQPFSPPIFLREYPL